MMHIELDPAIRLLAPTVPSQTGIFGTASTALGAKAATRDRAGYLTRDQIAIVEIWGVVTKNASDAGVSTPAVARQVQDAADDDHIKAVMLYVDSGGGSIAAIANLSDVVAEAAQRKPVHAFIDDIATSAAYFAVCQSLRITAGQTAIVGALGVYNAVVDSSEEERLAGIKTHLVTTGEFKGAGKPGTRITESQLAHFQQTIDQIGSILFSKIESGRKLKGARLANVTDGKVFIGQQAVDVGLVDQIGTFADALAFLSKSIPAAPRALATFAQIRAARPHLDTMGIGRLLDAGTTVEALQAGKVA